jgi:hypothetical protein
VGRDAGAVADPDAGQRVAAAEVDIVLGAQAGQGGVDRGRADVDRAGPRLLACTASSSSTPSRRARTER